MADEHRKKTSQSKNAARLHERAKKRNYLRPAPHEILSERRSVTPPTRPEPGKIDLGVRKAVKTLQDAGIETFESCEGGRGHAYHAPTVAFYGTPEAGWRAVAVCLSYGLPIRSLQRVWSIDDGNEPTGPHWEIVFKYRPG